MYSTIVVGTDGSASSMEAVLKAADLAALSGATLHIACAVRPAYELAAMAAPAVSAPIPWDREFSEGGTEATAAACELAATRGAQPQAHVLSGEAAGALVKLCESLGADLLVVGNRGMTGAARFLLGSVPNRCAHHAPCSVLIVRTS